MKAPHFVGLITCLLTMVLVPATVRAQSTFTQVGTWNCIIPSGTQPGFACPTVTFPQSFGGIPNVIVTGSATGIGQALVDVPSIQPPCHPV